MKNVIHYSNITFTALLVSTFVWGYSHKDTAIAGVIILCTCWCLTRIVREGIFSLAYLMSSDDDETESKDQQKDAEKD